MLVEIRCDKFAKDFQTISFHNGLNTVLGSTGGSNALGKSTFLWIIDYAFGGEYYCSSGSDVKQNVKDHTIFFTFLFDDTYHYFYRSTASPKTVCRCDKTGHLMEKMSLADYRKFLAENYHPGVPFEEIPAHYFRIYGRDNTYEKMPLLTQPREADEKAVDFLLRLFGKAAILNSIHAMEEEIGIKASQWKSSKGQPKSFEKIEENEKTIAAQKERLEKLMAQNESTGMEFLGFDTETFERVSDMQRELRKLTRRRNQLKSRLTTVQDGNKEFISEAIKEDFTELSEFFPGVNLKAFEDIDNFHIRIREILKEEIEDEVSSLEPLIKQCDAEINRLKAKIEQSGIASDLSQRILSQCVSVSKHIDELEAENRDLRREKELQEARVLAERKMEKLISEQQSAMDEIVTAINLKLSELNKYVTGGKEIAPMLTISKEKEITFSTVGNTSEGTACKSMALFDLAILSLTGAPSLIHDGNVLKSISREHFEQLLKLYSACDKQVFIAVDRAEDELLQNSTILHLSEGHELYGYSWSRKQ